MRLIRGETLKDRIDRFHRVDPRGVDPAEQRLALRRILASFIAACNAMAYAHSQGVIHRDLKPANIMLGEYGETFVIDWGLAKVEGPPVGSAIRDDPPRAPRFPDEPHATAVGQVIGTPAYMSPEQLSMDQPTRIGTASDVYGLGATLYHILTGQPPLRGSVLQIMELLLKGDIPRPRSINASVDPALEAICLKAMAHEPDGRYASPRGLAEDIERWLAAESSATPTRPSWVTRWARARRGIRPRETPGGRQ
jgi:serine/threonine protein kinase